MTDPLDIRDPRRLCRSCENQRRLRRKCQHCNQTGYEAASLEGLWGPRAFLVCGGPSLRTLDLSRLRERGVCSLAVNNAAGFAPCDAWTFSDPQTKFHHALFLDPKVVTFAPTPKLRKHVRIKRPDGTFRMTSLTVGECPNTWGYSRSGQFHAETFFQTPFAHWGMGGRQSTGRPFTRLATMLIGLRLLHYLGARQISLLGVDFHIDKGQPYAWGQDKGGGNRAWPKIEALFRMLLPVLERRGVQIFNCNPASRLTLFPYVSYDQAIASCKGHVPDEPLDLSGWYNKGLSAQCKRLESVDLTL